MDIGILTSGGKDSLYSAYLASKKNKIKCLISFDSENKDSYMFHSANINLVKVQAELMNLPLIFLKTRGEKEIELEDLKNGILIAKDKYHIKGIVTGAVASSYQSERIGKICDELKLKCLNPLWHIDTEQYLKDLVKNKFGVIITKVAADGFDEKWLGREINNNFIEDLKKLNKRFKIHLAFEGGEAESLVLNCPLFKKKIVILESEKNMESKCCGELLIRKIKTKDI